MGLQNELVQLHFISSHSETESLDSEFLDAEEFAQLSFTLGCLISISLVWSANSSSQQLSHNFF